MGAGIVEDAAEPRFSTTLPRVPARRRPPHWSAAERQLAQVMSRTQVCGRRRRGRGEKQAANNGNRNKAI
jgi:hypothetical protein